MARLSYPRAGEPRPAALPPAERTVGQLVAETLQLYSRRFWRALPLGVPVAVLDYVDFKHGVNAQMLLLWAFAPLLTAAYVGASTLVAERPAPRRALATAFAAGLVVFLPFPLLFRIYLVPGLVLFALVGLAVPAAVIERRGVAASLRRGFELARADGVHAFFSIFTVAVVYFLSKTVLLFLLRTEGDQAQEVAGFLADLVLSPLLFLGPALLYADQAARVKVGHPEERGGADADLHPAVEALAAGRPDAEVEP